MERSEGEKGWERVVEFVDCNRGKRVEEGCFLYS